VQHCLVGSEMCIRDRFNTDYNSDIHVENFISSMKELKSKIEQL
jgi:hypothetical protein